MKNIVNWKLFFILLIACVIASLFVIPYTLTITGAEVKPVINEVEIPMAVLVIITAIQNAVMFGIVTFLGLLLSKQIGMGLPIIEGLLEKKDQSKEFKSILIPSVVLGVIAGILIIVISIPFDKAIPEFQNTSVKIPAWQGFLASFYGGIAEEVLLRLFVMSLFVWITWKIKKTEDGKPTAFGVWFSIILAAVLFGLGHLPATSAIVPLTAIVVIRAIVLNGIGGIIFGWLYWRKGLESAIIAHFSTDIVLHVITPFVLSLIVRAAA